MNPPPPLFLQPTDRPTMQYIQQAHIDTFTLIIEIQELESQTLVYIKKRVSRDEIKRYAE